MIENTEHIIFHCTTLSNTRQENLSAILNTMPIAMVTSYELMTVNEKLIFICSPLLSNYIPEWQGVYENIACMVYNIFAARAKCYDEQGARLTFPVSGH